MLVIWMFNFSVQFYGMWIVYGTASEEITTQFSCEMNEEVENDPCERQMLIVDTYRI